jgi:transposase
MRNYTRNNGQVSARDYDLFIGIDVDKASLSISVCDSASLLKSLKMPYNADNLFSFLQRHYPNEGRVVFAYEAGPTGFGLYDSIVSRGYDCLVASPAGIPKAPNSRVKTNRLDSKKLAELLRGGQLQSIRVPPESIRQLRSLTHLRYTYMQERRAYKCRIKAELLKEGIAFPKAPKGSQWSRKVTDELRSLDCSAVIGYKISSMLDHIEHLSRQLDLVEVAIRSHVNGDQDLKNCVEYLMSCPGIGWRIAWHTLARIGDWRRLGPSKEAGSFFGLVPCENSTGDRAERGSITKCGDPRLRSMLIQGAWTAIRKDSELKAFYDQVFASHSIKVAARVAIVAVARKLAERMHCVLKEQRNYQMRVAA